MNFILSFRNLKRESGSSQVHQECILAVQSIQYISKLNKRGPKKVACSTEETLTVLLIFRNFIDLSRALKKHLKSFPIFAG